MNIGQPLRRYFVVPEPEPFEQPATEPVPVETTPVEEPVPA